MPKSKIQVLEKRRNHLISRIKNTTDKRLTYDEAEVAALDWALNIIKQTLGKDYNDGEKNSVSN